MAGLQKSGYVLVKQPANIKGRKLKTWRRKWAVLHKMSNIAEGTFAAKLDLYPDESSASNSSQDKTTYIFENVTAIQSPNSKTQKYAFEIVEAFPVLCLATQKDLDTMEWVKAFRYIFWPPPGPDGEDLFQVIIEENEDSKKYSMSGEYWMLISPQELKVKAMSKEHTLSWKLSNLKRFNLDSKNSKILIIESGAISDFGEAKFMFRSSNVINIFRCIKKNISLAVEQRHRKMSSGSMEERGRTSSGSNSEKGYRMLLERSRENLRASTESIDESISNETKNKSKSHESLKDEITSVVSSSPPVKPHLPPKTLKDGHLSNCYDELELPSTAKVNAKRDSPEIVSTEIVQDKVNERLIEVNHDKYGYSHIPCQVLEDPRINLVRSVSGYAEVDLGSPTNEQHRPVPNRVDTSPEFRSGSLLSNDSGFATSPVTSEPSDGISRRTSITLIKANHKHNNSFDSAISTSSGAETISATVNDVLLVTEKETFPQNKGYENAESTDAKLADHSDIYSDVAATHVLETQYEDLEKYRKDLSKFLGMDPKVNPEDVPPSLPDRPASLPIRRKVFLSKTKKTKHNKKVTFPRLLKDRNNQHDRTASMTSNSSTSSSSSVSDGEDDSPLPKVQSFSVLRNMQRNTLYEQSTIESEASNSDAGMEEQREDSYQRSHSCGPILVGASKHLQVEDRAQDATVKMQEVKTVSFDLLTGELLQHPPIPEDHCLDLSIMTPTKKETPNFPPVVEQLISIDMPENKSSEITFETTSEGIKDQLIFRSKPDGNFLWDPFPTMANYDRPLIDFDSNPESPVSSKDNPLMTLDTSCYECMESVKGSEPRSTSGTPDLSLTDQAFVTSTPYTASADNMDPFNIFNLKSDLVRSRTHSCEHMVCDDPNKKQTAVDLEATYMDMSRASTPADEDAYVCPSSVEN